MKDIKNTLFAVLGKRKMGKPDYLTVEEVKGQRFRSQLTVQGIAYTGFGRSKSKKDAQTNAAMDFANYLVREGLVNASEFPQLQQQEQAMQAQGPDAPIPPAPAENFADEQVPPNGQEFFIQQEPGFSGDSAPVPAPILQQYPNHQPRAMHDEYVEQRAEEVQKSEAVDMTADIHGGWTLENCKQALNEFLQKYRLPSIEYKITKTEGHDNSCTTVAEYELYLAQQNKKIFGRGQGSNKKMAQTTCALSIVRQLFHIGILPAAAGVQASRGKKGVDDLREIKVQVDPYIVERIDKILENSGVQPVTDDLAQATPDNPRSLLVDQKLDDFPESDGPRNPTNTIMWAPPQQNWNAWRAENIDTQPIAFWPMERISADLLGREMFKEIPARMKKSRTNLPVYGHREEILRAVQENQVVLIKGSTGCGKSTQICQYLMESHIMANRGAHFNCYVTQPRRISAITLAERVAKERQEQPGDSVGYSVRFESVHPRPYGAVMFVTVGVLLRKMEMGLRGISHVIIDEIHERDINTDFMLIIMRDLVRSNPNLRILLMSATIDTTMFTDYFGGQCPIVDIEQAIFPVQSFFLEDVVQLLQFMPPEPEPEKKKKKKKGGAAERTVEAGAEEEEGGDDSMAVDGNLLICSDQYGPNVKLSLSRMSEKDVPIDLIESLLVDIDRAGVAGAVLIFLPGWQLISMIATRLGMHQLFGTTRFVILPLHSQLPAREQHRVFEPVGENQRKIILSTNIAETSVTIDDVVYVIDSCRVREKMYTTRNNMVHFANVWASRTNLIQRRGRAGRVQPGYCFHLITKARFDALEEHRTPEMLRTPLHEITLAIKLLQLGSTGQFLEKAVQPPPIDAVVEAEVLLREMNALDRRLELTKLGRILARLPIEPKLGRMLILGAALGVGDLMLTAAAATSFNTPFVPRERVYTKLSHQHRAFSGHRFSDHIGLVNVNQQFEAELNIGGEMKAESFCRANSLSFPLLQMTREAKRQLRDVLIKAGFPQVVFEQGFIDVHGADLNLDTFLSMLVSAYYPNVCYLRDKRRVFTLEQATALLSSMSVCVPFNRGAGGDSFAFPSPLFVFTEKVKVTSESFQQFLPTRNSSSFADQFAASLNIQNQPQSFQLRTSCISCKQCSMISPLQLLLFGSRRVEAIGENRVRLDKMIPLDMPAHIAAKIVALRPCVDALLVRTCMQPEQLVNLSEADHTLIEILRQLSSDLDWQPTGEEGLEPLDRNDGPSTSNAGEFMRYNAADQEMYERAQRRNFNLPMGPGPFSPRKRPFGAPPPSVVAAFGNQMNAHVPPNAGQEAVSAAMGQQQQQPQEQQPAEERVPFEQQDFSTMAGFGRSTYFGRPRNDTAAWRTQVSGRRVNGGFARGIPMRHGRGGGGRVRAGRGAYLRGGFGGGARRGRQHKTQKQIFPPFICLMGFIFYWECFQFFFNFSLLITIYLIFPNRFSSLFYFSGNCFFL